MSLLFNVLATNTPPPLHFQLTGDINISGFMAWEQWHPTELFHTHLELVHKMGAGNK